MLFAYFVYQLHFSQALFGFVVEQDFNTCIKYKLNILSDILKSRIVER